VATNTDTPVTLTG